MDQYWPLIPSRGILKDIFVIERILQKRSYLMTKYVIKCKEMANQEFMIFFIFISGNSCNPQVIKTDCFMTNEAKRSGQKTAPANIYATASRHKQEMGSRQAPRWYQNHHCFQSSKTFTFSVIVSSCTSLPVMIIKMRSSNISEMFQQHRRLPIVVVGSSVTDIFIWINIQVLAFSVKMPTYFL